MQYRPEIDGLRAIAVLPVILFHAGFELFTGGFVGVDIFFVISGYLISAILLGELEQGRFLIGRFYERRARRILPALFAVVSCCLPLAWLWLTPVQLRDFGESVVAVVFFASNVLFWQEQGYFAPDAELKPLLHTWSLAVEEQFYIVFPLFLAFLHRFARRWAFEIIALSGALSLTLCVWASRPYPEASFFLAPTRAWELLAGSLCAFLLARTQPRASDLGSGLGLALLLVAIFGFDRETPFPSLYTLAPVAGTALIVLFGGRGTWTGRVLSAPPVVGLGLISYSAYLWHQPVLSFARLRAVTRLSEGEMGLLVALTLLLAWGTWRFVETPFRGHGPGAPESRWRGSGSSRRASVLTGAAAAALALTLLGGTAVLFHGFDSRVDLEAKARALGLDAYELDNESLRLESWRPLQELTGVENYGTRGNAVDREPWTSATTGEVRILLVGNSHSRDVFNTLFRSREHARAFSLSRFGIQVCDLLLDDGFFSSENFARADLIFIVSRYSQSDVEALPAIFDRMKREGKPTAIALNTPEFSGDIALSMVDKIMWHEGSALEGRSRRSVVRRIDSAHFADYARNRELRERNLELARIARAHSIPVFSREAYICDSEAERCSGITEQGAKLFYDYGHNTIAGASLFARRIDALRWPERLVELVQRSVVGASVAGGGARTPGALATARPAGGLSGGARGLAAPRPVPGLIRD